MEPSTNPASESEKSAQITIMATLRISPKHGVNPSISTCFWCGKPTNALVLFGRMKDDREAGQYCGPIDYEPCEECKTGMSQGITIIEVVEFNNDNPEIQKGLYPTGKMVVVKEEAVLRIFTPEATESMLKHRKSFMDAETFTQLFTASESETIPS
jgi:hypothetical protein